MTEGVRAGAETEGVWRNCVTDEPLPVLAKTTEGWSGCKTLPDLLKCETWSGRESDRN